MRSGRLFRYGQRPGFRCGHAPKIFRFEGLFAADRGSSVSPLDSLRFCSRFLPVVSLSGASLALLMPMAGVITQPVRDGHPAIDISCVEGTPVRAAHDGHGGTRWNRDLGWVFTLNGGGGLQTTYAISRAAPPPAALPGAR